MDYLKRVIITSPQGAEITVSTGETVLNFCANNYLGFSSHPEVVQAAKRRFGFARISECRLYVLFAELKTFTKI